MVRGRQVYHEPWKSVLGCSVFHYWIFPYFQNKLKNLYKYNNIITIIIIISIIIIIVIIIIITIMIIMIIIIVIIIIMIMTMMIIIG